MSASNQRDRRVEILVESHDLELGAGTNFVSCLEDAATTLVTRGLAASGHPELALVLFRAPAAFPDDRSVDAALAEMTDFLRDLASTVTGSRPMREGTTISFKRGLVKPHLRGMAWVKPPLLGRAACVPPGALVGVPLFLDEFELASKTSPYRVLTRLGMEIQEFPFPPWLDAMRASVSLGDAERSSWLCRLPSARTDVVFLAEHTDGNPHPDHLVKLLLKVRASARTEIMRTFSMRTASVEAFALVGVPSDEAGARLAWRPDIRGFFAIESPGAGFQKLTGTFFAIAPDEKFRTDRAVIGEDGYTLFPTVASWTRLQAALATGAPLALPAPRARVLRTRMGGKLSWRTPHAAAAAPPNRRTGPVGRPLPPTTGLRRRARRHPWCAWRTAAGCGRGRSTGAALTTSVTWVEVDRLGNEPVSAASVRRYGCVKSIFHAGLKPGRSRSKVSSVRPVAVAYDWLTVSA